MGEGKREGAPKGRPVVKVESVQALGRAMEGRANSAAYVENTLPADKRKLIRKAVLDKKFRQELYLGFESHKLNKSKEQTLDERFQELVLFAQKRYGSKTKKFAEIEQTLKILKDDLASLCAAFPKYKLKSIRVTYENRLISLAKNVDQALHTDGGREIDEYGNYINYVEPTEESLRVVRTFVGPSTEYLKDNDRQREEIITPAEGSTTVHSFPSLVWHRAPLAKRNQVRFALILDFEPV